MSEGGPLELRCEKREEVTLAMYLPKKVSERKKCLETGTNVAGKIVAMVFSHALIRMLLFTGFLLSFFTLNSFGMSCRPIDLETANPGQKPFACTALPVLQLNASKIAKTGNRIK
jgi:hypothetical protein